MTGEIGKWSEENMGRRRLCVFVLFYMGEACPGVTGREHAERREKHAEQVSDERAVGPRGCRGRGK